MSIDAIMPADPMLRFAIIVGVILALLALGTLLDYWISHREDQEMIEPPDYDYGDDLRRQHTSSDSVDEPLGTYHYDEEDDLLDDEYFNR